MSVLVAKEAPDFKAQAVMPDGSFAELSLEQFRGILEMLLPHAAPREILEQAKRDRSPIA